MDCGLLGYDTCSLVGADEGSSKTLLTTYITKWYPRRDHFLDQKELITCLSCEYG
jgi:hypothetical protein